MQIGAIAQSIRDEGSSYKLLSSIQIRDKGSSYRLSSVQIATIMFTMELLRYIRNVFTPEFRLNSTFYWQAQLQNPFWSLPAILKWFGACQSVTFVFYWNQLTNGSRRAKCCVLDLKNQFFIQKQFQNNKTTRPSILCVTHQMSW